MREASQVAAVGVFLAIGLCGCYSDVLAPTNRPALGADQVELLAEPPTLFELHGLVVAASDVSETYIGDRTGWFIHSIGEWNAEATVEQLKVAAGARGANAILISAIGGKDYNPKVILTYDPSVAIYPIDERFEYVGASYRGKGFYFPVTRDQPRKMVAMAIFVVKK